MIFRALLLSIALCAHTQAQPNQANNRWTSAGNAIPDLYSLLNSGQLESIQAAEAEVGFTKVRLGDGRYLQQHWAVALADFAKENGASEVLTKRWLAEKGPDSYACPLLASVFFNQAFKARGGGYADTVTAAANETMSQKLDAADVQLGSCSDRIKQTLFWNIVRLRITFSNDNLRQLRKSHFDAAIAMWPDADEIYEPALMAALPVWGGSVEEMEDIIDAATVRTNARLKTILYGRLYQNLLTQQSQLTLNDTRADWARLKQSMADFRLLKEPDLDGYMAYIRFACGREDYAETRLLLDSAQQRYSQSSISERARTRVLGTLALYESDPCFIKARALPKAE